MENAQKIAQVNRGKEIQSKRKYYQEHKHEIVKDAISFGPGYAMDKWGINLITLQQYIERSGNGKAPAIYKQAMYPDGESYSQGVVKAIIHTIEDLKDTISKLDDQLARKDAIIAEKDTKIKKLQEEKQSFGALGWQKEETIMEELLNQIK